MKKQKLLKKLHLLARVGHDMIGQEDLERLHAFITKQIREEEGRGKMRTERYDNGFMHTIEVVKKGTQ